MKKNLIFLFYLLAGIIVGSLVAALTASVSWLSWLNFGIHDLGIGAGNPVLINLSVLKIWLGLSFSLTVAHVIAIGAALALYSARRGK